MDHFYTDSAALGRLMPKAISGVFDQFEMETVAIWNTTLDTEIYLMSNEPDSTEMETFENLSQSILQYEIPDLEPL